jgi:hypothetical protein
MTTVYNSIIVSVIFLGVVCVASLKARETSAQKPAFAKKNFSSPRTITVKNYITDDQLKVHRCGTHMPDLFSLSIYESDHQQKELFSYDHKEKKSCASDPMQVVLQDNRITLNYSYSFAWGAYKATKRVCFELPSGIQMIKVSFSFDHEQRVIIPQAQLVGPIESVS